MIHETNLTTATPTNPVRPPPAMFSSLVYRGLEVLLSPLPNGLAVIHARTGVIFQRIPISGVLVTMACHPTAGHIFVALEQEVKMLCPIEAQKEIHGKYRWVEGSVLVDCHVVLGRQQQQEDQLQQQLQQQRIVICPSLTPERVLIVCHDTLSILDFSRPNAKLVWSFRIGVEIKHAALSGDGAAIALALKGEGVGVPYPFGVRTFVAISTGARGQGLAPSYTHAHGITKYVDLQGRTVENPPLPDAPNDPAPPHSSSSQQQNGHYHQGPFLVHPSPVTRLSFRGYGTLTSSHSHHKPTLSHGNDLLLTTSSTSSVHIFSQNSWRQLLTWNSPPKTRADWIHGSTAANIGDLDSTPHKKRSKSPSSIPKSDPGSYLRTPSTPVAPDSTHHSEPTHAGAWIAELTLRNASLPALRLSRLSYLRSRGEDALPAHFESVAAVLPGSIHESVLHEHISVRGIWPLWDPWEEDGKGRARVSEHEFGGTHSPPSELSIVTCREEACLNIIEMPLWGDADFGAMEFGSPVVRVLSVMTPAAVESAHLEFEGSTRLCAGSRNRRTIDLWWRKHGSVHLEEEFLSEDGPKVFRDVGITPLPLRLPSLVLPGKTANNGAGALSSLYWWPDENLGGSPRLVVLTQGGTLIVFEIPPPSTALEPPMPSYDPLNDCESRGSSVDSNFASNNGPITADSFDGDNERYYEVDITPHPDFGIGLRLEAQARGMPAIVGSFKTHPLSGGRLPAERSGVIALGDEFLAVNDLSFEGCSFEDTIAGVRRIGIESIGAPLRMRFRRCGGKRSRGSVPSSSVGSMSGPSRKYSGDGGSHVTVEVGTYNLKEFGRIIAVVRDVVVGMHDQSSPPAMLLIPWNFGKGAVVSTKMVCGALILWVVPGQKIIKAGRLEVILDLDPENARFTEIGSVSLDDRGKDKQSTIKSINFVSSTEKGWLVATHDSAGNISLVFVETCTVEAVPDSQSKLIANFRKYVSVFNIHEVDAVDAVCSKIDPNESLIMRSFSIELFGCMMSRVDCKELRIWTSLPQTVHRADPSGSDSNYRCSIISINEVRELSTDVIVDFRWVRSGFVDAFPWLVIFTRTAAVLYRRPCHQLQWQTCAILMYKTGTIIETISPHDAYPHLISALRCAVLDSDEQSLLRSDWHPESILANICTEELGVHSALKSHTYGLYSWLSRWMNTDESLRPTWHARGLLPSAPFKIVNDHTVMHSFCEKVSGDVETSANLMSALSLNPTDSKPPSEEESLMSDLLKAMCPLGSHANNSTRNKAESDAKPLPTPLRNMGKDELTCIWVIADIICNMPSFKRLDSLSQLLLFSVTLMRRLIAAKTHNLSMSVINQPMISYAGGRPTLLRQSSGMNMEQAALKFDVVASAAFLSALMSDTQMRLIESCRQKSEKFDWESARSVGLPFWIRSDKALLSITEEIAQSVYKSTKDVMSCALFYVAMRNMKMLRAIAATDRSDSGKKFLKFIVDHDFRSERGRKAAEKNAYSLLRKRKYAPAAAFFLLAEPPMTNTALDVIKSQMKDVSLAFLIARLIESTSKPNSAGLGDTLIIGGGINLSSMGGGGGFAGSGSTTDFSTEVEDSIKFSQWTPFLGQNARRVLSPDDKNCSNGDNCFDCLQLLWLNRPNEAVLRLSHMPTSRKVDCQSFHDVVSPFISKGGSKTISIASSPNDLLVKVNAVINFCSAPLLLKELKPKKRILWSSALLVSRALSHCGIAIPSMKILQNVADPSYDEQGGQRTTASNTHSSAANGSNPPETKQSLSIFDSFDLPPAQKPPTKPSTPVHVMPSSIFDTFDAPQPRPKVKSQPTTEVMPSSIFDSFETPQSKPKETHPGIGKNTKLSSSAASLPTMANASPGEAQQMISDIEQEAPLNIMAFPPIWSEWRECLITILAASRLLREMTRILSSFHGEPHYCLVESSFHHSNSSIPSAASEVLHKACDSVGLLNAINTTLAALKSSLGLTEEVVVEQALDLLSSSAQPRRLVMTVLLQSLLGRSDLAEDTVRNAAVRLMNNSELLGLSNVKLVNTRNDKHDMSSRWVRQDSSNTIWQLELCLWLHRGDTFVISPNTVKETVLAMRAGLASINWGRCHQTLDTLIKAEPDCQMDFNVGQNLWRSMKIISSDENTIDCVEGVTSGGWEFLVDCRREEATEMLRDGMPGRFLIRPHPQDPGVFTLSFKTNLVPTEMQPAINYDDAGAINTNQESHEVPSPSKVIKRDDVVQHAIVRLTDSGFRCGSFGPFANLKKLLKAVSESLPFDLRFHDPPAKGIIKEQGNQPSPNAVLFKKLALQSTTDFIHSGSEISEDCGYMPHVSINGIGHRDTLDGVSSDKKRKFGLFLELLFLTEFRKQLCAIAAARVELKVPHHSNIIRRNESIESDLDGSISEGSLNIDDEEDVALAARMVRPYLNWCRSRELEIVEEIAPMSHEYQHQFATNLSVAMKTSADEFEVPSSSSAEGCTTGGDAMIHKMIQPGSGVDFRTLRVGEPGNSVIVVLFGKEDSIRWLAAHETGGDENEAQERLKVMEQMRVIEPITSCDLSLPKNYAASHPSATSRYRFVDPWEVEALDSKAGETASATIGRGKYHTLTEGLVASACEHIIRTTGGLHLLGLWCTLKGGVFLTKALCSAHPTWERGAGGDLLMRDGFLMEPSPYENSIRKHLYGNVLFRSLKLPQRFLALIQVDLLDLKNVTAPSGSSSLTAYALLRLKRKGSSAPLNHKARSLDSALTQARKISKISGPNAPASWGNIVRFRFPLPEDVNCEGSSFDLDRDSLFKGPPTSLQVTVYEKKFMSDVELGGADVSLDSLGSGGQIEEWVPLRVGKDGITWFARMRISLYFELMCLDSTLGSAEDKKDSSCPSAGLQKIRNLSRLGAHEDHKVKSSTSTPDLMGYFGNMLY